MIRDMEELPYEERLKRLQFILEKWWLKGDMIEISKIMNSEEKVIKEVWFTHPHNTGTRGHPMKLTGSRFKNKHKEVLLPISYSSSVEFVARGKN